MKLCYRCNSQMVQVDLIDLRKRKHSALVCIYCGRTYTKDKAFSGRVNLKVG